MKDFSIIYKILKALHGAMDCDEFDEDLISAERLHISENKRIALIEMLCENELVCGISIQRGADGGVIVNETAPRITLKGLQYLEENSMMKKAAAAAKGIKDMIPGA